MIIFSNNQHHIVLHVELDPQKHLITQGWNYSSASTLDPLKKDFIQTFNSLISITENFPHTFPIGSHKSILAVVLLQKESTV